MSYDREYFQVGTVRLTIDTGIEYTAPGSLFPIKDGSSAVEVKAPDKVSVDMLTQLIPQRRTRFSKYARGISAIQKGSSDWLI